MGGNEEHVEVHTGKAEQQVRGLKSESEDLIESYKSLKTKIEGNKRSIVGLTTEMEEAKKRIRLLLIKRVAAEGPDYDEYQISRKVSKTYQPIDASRRRSVAGKRAVSIDIASPNEDAVKEESSASSVSAVSVKVTVNPSGVADVEVAEE